MKYEFVSQHRLKHRVKKMCKVLKINESGYYRWTRQTPGRKEIEDQKTVAAIREIHEEFHHTYGAVRVQRELLKRRIICGIGRIYRLMRENGIYTVHRCKHRPYPKEPAEARFSENLLEQQFLVEQPNQAWVGDITYIRSDLGWSYLAAILDLFNKEVVGYAISRKPNTELVKRAMEQALLNRDYPQDLLFHSDRGCQYSSKSYQSYLEENGITSSMSRKGNPFDNACCESFFASLKKEWIYFRKFANMNLVESSVFEYIELFYNRKRMHSALGYMSPKQYLEKFTNVVNG
jgi:putative transposase